MRGRWHVCYGSVLSIIIIIITGGIDESSTINSWLECETISWNCQHLCHQGEYFYKRGMYYLHTYSIIVYVCIYIVHAAIYVPTYVYNNMYVHIYSESVYNRHPLDKTKIISLSPLLSLSPINSFIPPHFPLLHLPPSLPPSISPFFLPCLSPSPSPTPPSLPLTLS